MAAAKRLAAIFWDASGLLDRPIGQWCDGELLQLSDLCQMIKIIYAIL